MESGKDLFYFWGKNIIHRKEVTYLSLLKSCLFILQNIGNSVALGHLVHARAVCNRWCLLWRPAWFGADGPCVWDSRNTFFKEQFFDACVQCPEIASDFLSLSVVCIHRVCKNWTLLCIILFISQVSVKETWRVKGFIVEIDPLSNMRGAGEVKVLWGESEG